MEPAGAPIQPAIKRSLASYKQLILCADGTWTASDRGDNSKPSNVARLARAVATDGLDKDENIIKQIVSYHAGVGSAGLPLQKGLEGAFGWGLEDEVCRIYDFISNNYDPGDELFFFGWSRGAFTVRSVAGLVSDVGVLSARQMSHFSELWAAYRTRPVGETFRESEWYDEHKDKWGLTDVSIKVVGVWDTVGALGIPEWDSVRWLRSWGAPINNKYKFHNTGASERIDYTFQVLALDERREPFPPTLWHRRPDSGPKIDLQQCWFPGVHGTIGGTAPGEIAINSFAWMADNLSGMITFEQETIKELVTSHETAVNSVAKGWGCGPVVDNFARVRDLLGWGILGIKDHTPGEYRDADGREASSNLTNKTFHPMVRMRRENLPGGYNPGSLGGFFHAQQDGRWHWSKGNIKLPEYKIKPDKRMAVSYRRNGQVEYDSLEPMSVSLCPRGFIQ